VKHLLTIWKDLRPDLKEEAVERKFAGQSLTAEQAGDVFERWLLEAFRLSGMVGHYAFRVPFRGSGSTREQIDGLLFDGWAGFLIESKFWTKKVDFGPIALLDFAVGTRPVGTLGLFFSGFGYTAAALESAQLLRPIRVLLFDQEDLDWALDEKALKGSSATKGFRGRMAEMVKRKWMLAVKFGHPAVSVTTLIEFFP
jgi:hypothetical protein